MPGVDMFLWCGEHLSAPPLKCLYLLGFCNGNVVSCGSAKVEAAGIEPHASQAPPHASSAHTHAPTRHLRALRPSRDPHSPPHEAPTVHEQHTDVHGERARSVHGDLHTVITAWPTLSEDIRATIRRLVATEEVRG
jgi:hypothetical protein